MSNKLTIKQIKEKLFEVESRYYKGWKENEDWWRISGDVHPTDRRLWTRYQNLLNKRKEEADKQNEMYRRRREKTHYCDTRKEDEERYYNEL